MNNDRASSTWLGGSCGVPTAWRNISGLHHLNATKLKALGWLPVNLVDFQPFDPAVQIRTGPDFTVGASKVVATYVVRDKTAQELDDEHEARQVNAEAFYNSPEISALIDAIEDNVPAARGKIRADARAKIP